MRDENSLIARPSSLRAADAPPVVSGWGGISVCEGWLTLGLASASTWREDPVSRPRLVERSERSPTWTHLDFPGMPDFHRKDDGWTLAGTNGTTMFVIKACPDATAGLALASVAPRLTRVRVGTIAVQHDDRLSLVPPRHSGERRRPRPRGRPIEGRALTVVVLCKVHGAELFIRFPIVSPWMRRVLRASSLARTLISGNDAARPDPTGLISSAVSPAPCFRQNGGKSSEGGVLA